MQDPAVRVLAVAPYESMRTALTHAAESFPGIQLDVRIADLDAGAGLVRSLDAENRYNAIISRGGTAERIHSATGIPVIHVAVSMYDVLRTIRLAQNYARRIAVVGFPAVTESAHTVCDLLRYRVDILTIHNEQEAREALQRLKHLSTEAVVCDTVTHRAAREMGFPAFLITSGEESMHDALRQAESIGAMFRNMRREIALMQIVMHDDATAFYALDEAGTLLRWTQSKPSQALLDAMRRRMRGARPDADVRFHYREQNRLHTITGRVADFEGQTLYLFRDQLAQVPPRVGRHGLRAFDREECEQLFLNSFYAISGAMGELNDRLPAIAGARQSTLLLGEEGTGKEQIARALYLRSALANHPFYVVDCEMIDERNWEYLLDNYASPLSSRDCTVYFRRLEALEDARWPELTAAIADSALERRIWLIFSCTLEGESVPDRVRKFASRIDCQTLHMSTLRSRSDELPSLAMLYLNRLNQEFGKEISGFDPGAMELLAGYDWPGNYAQFKHVLEELAQQAQSSYISSNACYEVLRKQRRLNRAAPSEASEGGVPWRQRTMEEIEGDIIARSLAENGGNQTLTARQLGISRTTLWRILRARGGQR